MSLFGLSSSNTDTVNTIAKLTNTTNTVQQRVVPKVGSVYILNGSQASQNVFYNSDNLSITSVNARKELSPLRFHQELSDASVLSWLYNALQQQSKSNKKFVDTVLQEIQSVVSQWGPQASIENLQSTLERIFIQANVAHLIQDINATQKRSVVEFAFLSKHGRNEYRQNLARQDLKVVLDALGQQRIHDGYQKQDFFDNLVKSVYTRPGAVSDKDQQQLCNLFLQTLNCLSTNTAATTTNLLYFIANVPNLANSLRKEIQNNPQKFSLAQRLDQFTSLDNYLSETLRLTETGCSFRKTIADVEVDGTVIPRNSLVALNPQSVYLNANVFAVPRVFNANRFNASKQANKKKSDNQNADDQPLLSESSKQKPAVFGAGSHACPGQAFATAQIKLAVLSLLSSFEFGFQNNVSGTSLDVATFEQQVPLRVPASQVNMWYFKQQ